MLQTAGTKTATYAAVLYGASRASQGSRGEVRDARRRLFDEAEPEWLEQAGKLLADSVPGRKVEQDALVDEQQGQMREETVRAAAADAAHLRAGGGGAYTPPPTLALFRGSG